MQVKKKGTSIMQERIVRYTSEELRDMRHLSLSNLEALKNITDDDIDFDDFPDSTDEELATAKHIDFEKRYQEAMAKKSVGKPIQQENLKKVMIRLDEKTLSKLKTLGRGWTGKVRNIIQDWVSKTLL